MHSWRAEHSRKAEELQKTYYDALTEVQNRLTDKAVEKLLEAANKLHLQSACKDVVRTTAETIGKKRVDLLLDPTEKALEGVLKGLKEERGEVLECERGRYNSYGLDESPKESAVVRRVDQLIEDWESNLEGGRQTKKDYEGGKIDLGNGALDSAIEWVLSRS